MTRAEIIAALQGVCGHCGHRWLQHPAAQTGAPRIEHDRIPRARVVLAPEAIHRDPLASGNGLCAQCACPARCGFMADVFFVVVPRIFPCCGIEGALFTTEPAEIAGAPWRTSCARCGAGLAVSQLVDVAVLQ